MALQNQSIEGYKGVVVLVVTVIYLTCLLYLAIFLEPQTFINPFSPSQPEVLFAANIVADTPAVSSITTDTPPATPTILPSHTPTIVPLTVTPTITLSPTITPTSTVSSSARISASIPSNNKWIDIDIGDQTITAYFGNTRLKTVLVSTGVARHPTPIGRYAVYMKLRSQDMSGGYAAERYYLPGVPWVMYFTGSYAIHGTYWHNNFGKPMSHGCINLSINDAKWFFDWAEIGTPVISHL